MKKNVMLVYLIFTSAVSFPQIPLASSKWNAHTEVPGPIDLVLEFKTNEILIFLKDGQEAERMTFSQHHDSLFIRKISGMSPCPEGAEVWYRIEWLENGEKFLLHNINDSCPDRVKGFTQLKIVDRVRQSNEVPRNWSYKSLSKDSLPGISLYGAYELLQGKKSQPVIVAVIAGGIDMKHEDIKDVIWKNPKEIPSNGIDEDKNGYVDDTWGWNFLSDKKGNTVWVLQREETQIYKLFKDKYENADPKKLTPAEKKEYEVFQKAKKEWKKGYEIAEALKLVLRDSSAFFSAIEKLRNETKGKPNTWDALLAVNPGNDSIIAAIQTGKDYFFPPRQDGPAYNQVLNRRGQAWQRNIVPPAEKFISFYDLDTDPAKIIGDNPANPYEKNYGSPYMIIEPGNNSLRHGTFIAGIIAAKKDGVGIDGIADNVFIMNIKAAASGSERDKDVANAIIYAVNSGAKVINMSFGKKYSSHKIAVDEAIQYAEKKDVLLVNSAGNDPWSTDSIPDFPVARYNNGSIATNFIEVGNSTMNYNEKLPAPNCSYGAKTVDLFAPGTGIYAPHPYNKYEFLGDQFSNSGTSVSAPYVSGIAALLKSYFPELSMVQIRKIIMETVHKPDLMVYRPGSQTLVPFKSLSISGGILDAEAAVRKAIEITKK